jgi:hypothetical protein
MSITVVVGVIIIIVILNIMGHRLMPYIINLDIKISDSGGDFINIKSNIKCFAKI